MRRGNMPTVVHGRYSVRALRTSSALLQDEGREHCQACLMCTAVSEEQGGNKDSRAMHSDANASKAA